MSSAMVILPSPLLMPFPRTDVAAAAAEHDPLADCCCWLIVVDVNAADDVVDKPLPPIAKCIDDICL